MQNNKNFLEAKRAKDDEFYTPREYVEELLPELEPYKRARVLCPCDSQESFYYRVLKENGFNVRQSSADFRLNAGLLPYNGEAIKKELWDWADLIVTNPPFSLATQLVDQCIETRKKFCLLVNLITFFGRKGFGEDYFMLTGLRYHDRKFKRPDGTTSPVGYCDYMQNFKGRVAIKGYNKPLYSSDCKTQEMQTPSGPLLCFLGGYLPTPGTYNEEFMAPLSSLYRIDEDDYKILRYEKKAVLDNKKQFTKVVLKYQKK